MKVVEIVGGLYTNVSDHDFRLVERMLEKKRYKLKKDDLPEKTQFMAQRLVDCHILDFDGEYYYLREVHIDVW